MKVCVGGVKTARVWWLDALNIRLRILVLLRDMQAMGHVSVTARNRRGVAIRLGDRLPTQRIRRPFLILMRRFPPRPGPIA